MKKAVFSVGFLTILALAGCANHDKVKEKEETKSTDYPIQILAVNDFHGSLDTTGTLHQQDGSEVKNAGSVAKLATVLNNSQAAFDKKYDASDKQTIRVEAGDLVGASPATSGLLQDEPTMKLFNMMNFKVGTLGNHEFDEGLPEFNRILQGKPWTGKNSLTQSAVKQYKQEKSKMSLVISNVVNQKNGKIPFDWKPYTTVSVGNGMKIGFIGILTPDIHDLVLKKNIEGYRVLDPAKQIVKYSKMLQKEGVNAICVLAHSAAGSEKGQSSEVEKMIDNVKKDDPKTSVDAVIAGHDHVLQNKTYRDILITESENQGKAVMNITGELSPKTKDFVKTPKASLEVVTDKTKEDEAVLKEVKEAQHIVSPIVNKVIGTVKNHQSISEKVNKDGISPVGSLITTAQYQAAKTENARVQAAITNTGGIRDDLVVTKKGDITWGAAQAVQPFGNVVQIVELKGKNIKDALTLSLNQPEATLQAHNITYQVKDKKAVNVKIDGKMLKDNQTYTIAMNDFLCGGGDHYEMLKPSRVLGGVGTDTDIFISYIQHHSPITTK